MYRVSVISDLMPRIKALSSDEKRELMNTLWTELEQEETYVDPLIVQLLEERMAHYEANPHTAITWEEAKKRLGR